MYSDGGSYRDCTLLSKTSWMGLVDQMFNEESPPTTAKKPRGMITQVTIDGRVVQSMKDSIIAQPRTDLPLAAKNELVRYGPGGVHILIRDRSLDFSAVMVDRYIVAFGWASGPMAHSSEILDAVMERILQFNNQVAKQLGAYYYLMTLQQLPKPNAFKVLRLMERNGVSFLGQNHVLGNWLLISGVSGAAFETNPPVHLGLKVNEDDTALEMLDAVAKAAQAGIEPRRIVDLMELGLAKGMGQHAPARGRE